MFIGGGLGATPCTGCSPYMEWGVPDVSRKYVCVAKKLNFKMPLVVR